MNVKIFVEIKIILVDFKIDEEKKNNKVTKRKINNEKVNN